MADNRPGVQSPHPRVADIDAESFDYATYAWQDILVSLDASTGIATVHLHRPAKANAYTSAMAFSLQFAFELFDVDPRVKVAILTGTGKTFCVGADLSMGFRKSATYAQQHRDEGGVCSLAILRCRKPTIAAVNGTAVGIGMTMILACDFRLVTNNAKVGIPFTKRGIAMEAASSFLLPRLVGVTKALDIILTGDIRSPSDPSFAALWTRAPYPTADDVLDATRKLAHQLATQNSTISMALCKLQIWRQAQSPEHAHLLESQAYWDCAQTDAKEGVDSFFEKRDPKFKGTLNDLERFAVYPWWTQADVQGWVRRAPPPPSKL
ncbi:uncharacterized protein PFL1_05488 [Pseudozyma flocculosa PF-1]|uniref:Related to enoyl-CoA hydratase n=2 Tax=Pseudozyma flocculosa TaxID=84751 RepID=A0A5C3FCJ8_9BASI|nr:uncharacterized protein PFL1_05488 [Pseudozyma flocculosa PF-1]EPQ26853.1 hypothetical protein PFL1_05488 [Pseudozyma flocculosa PF-1]SPO42078.1 related to enoyl-CoA hydratase [Pseudozyma flocculosa]